MLKSNEIIGISQLILIFVFTFFPVIYVSYAFYKKESQYYPMLRQLIFSRMHFYNRIISLLIISIEIYIVFILLISIDGCNSNILGIYFKCISALVFALIGITIWEILNFKIDEITLTKCIYEVDSNEIWMKKNFILPGYFYESYIERGDDFISKQYKEALDSLSALFRNVSEQCNLYECQNVLIHPIISSIRTCIGRKYYLKFYDLMELYLKEISSCKEYKNAELLKIHLMDLFSNNCKMIDDGIEKKIAENLQVFIQENSRFKPDEKRRDLVDIKLYIPVFIYTILSKVKEEKTVSDISSNIYQEIINDYVLNANESKDEIIKDIMYKWIFYLICWAEYEANFDKKNERSLQRKWNLYHIITCISDRSEFKKYVLKHIDDELELINESKLYLPLDIYPNRNHTLPKLSDIRKKVFEELFKKEKK